MDIITTEWLEIAFLLSLGVLSHFTFAKLKYPMVIGELLIGVVIALIATNILGIKIVQDETLQVLGQLGAIVLLFIIGLECDIKKVFSKKSILIAGTGVVATWAMIYLVLILMRPGASFGEMILLPTVFVSTSVAVTASVLRELDMINEPVGTAIIGAAVIDDILGMVALAISKGVILSQLSITNVTITIVASLLFIGMGILVGIKFISRAIDRIERKGRKLGLVQVDLTLVLATTLIYAVIADLIGVSAIVGAFVAGTIFASSTIKHQIRDGTDHLGADPDPDVLYHHWHAF